MTDAVRHLPVMLKEVLTYLEPKAGAICVDATFGGGGYAQAILEAAPCRVIAIDRDPEACARARDLIGRFGGRLTVLHGRFGDMIALLTAEAVDVVDAIAFDLGVSSHQLAEAARGFSFRIDGPLDMRMDKGRGATAADLVNTLPEADLARVLFEYGEERAARRIAAAVVKARQSGPIETTLALAEVVRTALPPSGQAIDPATRTFQALRIAVNDELGELERGLAAAERLLRPGGRLVVVAFHSLEDRRVKTFLRERAGGQPQPSRHRPTPAVSDRAPTFRLITGGALRSSAAEVAANPRARSARLRAAERTSAPAWPPSEGVGSERRAA